VRTGPWGGCRGGLGSLGGASDGERGRRPSFPRLDHRRNPSRREKRRRPLASSAPDGRKESAKTGVSSSVIAAFGERAADHAGGGDMRYAIVLSLLAALAVPAAVGAAKSTVTISAQPRAVVYG